MFIHASHRPEAALEMILEFDRELAGEFEQARDAFGFASRQRKRLGKFIRTATVKRRGMLPRRLPNLALELIPLAEFQRRQVRLCRRGRQRERGTEQQHRLPVVAEMFARVHCDFSRVLLRLTTQLPRGEALASANGCTGPLPCCRNITASNVSVHPESTTSSTSNTGPVGGLPSMANAPRRLRTC